MPVTRWSRHAFCAALRAVDREERKYIYLSEREPFGYYPFDDNRVHVVREGDTLSGLAGIYFEGLPRPSQFWWVIADFQPEPIADPTLDLAVGRMLFVPSIRTLEEEIFAEERRTETYAGSS